MIAICLLGRSTTHAQDVLSGGALQSTECLVVPSDEIYTMSEDETWDCVKVKGILRTNGRTLTITGSSGLKITPSGSLEITGGRLTLAAGGQCTINGRILIGTGFSRLRVEYDTTFMGAGEIAGQGAGAGVEIAASAQIINQIRFVGGMDILGEHDFGLLGMFTNRGVVRADLANESIVFSRTTSVTDSGVPNADDFMAVDGGRLIFYRALTTLKSSFTTADLGMLVFHATVRTSGELWCGPSSVIYISIGNEFTWGDPATTIDDSGSPYYGCP